LELATIIKYNTIRYKNLINNFFCHYSSFYIVSNKILINSLPNEILLEILNYLINYTSYKYATSLKILCKLWYALIKYAI